MSLLLSLLLSSTIDCNSFSKVVALFLLLLSPLSFFFCFFASTSLSFITALFSLLSSKPFINASNSASKASFTVVLSPLTFVSLFLILILLFDSSSKNPIASSKSTKVFVLLRCSCFFLVDLGFSIEADLIGVVSDAMVFAVELVIFVLSTAIILFISSSSSVFKFLSSFFLSSCFTLLSLLLSPFNCGFSSSTVGIDGDFVFVVVVACSSSSTSSSKSSSNSESL